MVQAHLHDIREIHCFIFCLLNELSALSCTGMDEDTKASITLVQVSGTRGKVGESFKEDTTVVCEK
jgi:hypothetical protein